MREDEDFSDFFSFDPSPIELAIQAMKLSTRAAFQPKVFVIDDLPDFGTRTGRIKSENHPPLHNLPKRK